MKKLEIGKAYKFLERAKKSSTSVYESNMFDYALENERILPAIRLNPSISLKCPAIFTVIDICPHFCKAYDKDYYCYKILVEDVVYTKFIHPNKEDFVEEVC